MLPEYIMQARLFKRCFTVMMGGQKISFAPPLSFSHASQMKN